LVNGAHAVKDKPAKINHDMGGLTTIILFLPVGVRKSGVDFRPCRIPASEESAPTTGIKVNALSAFAYALGIGYVRYGRVGFDAGYRMRPGVDRIKGAAVPARSMLAKMSRPTFPGVDEAPMTATDRGLNMASSGFTWLGLSTVFFLDLKGFGVHHFF
jgi:hypothetical protein